MVLSILPETFKNDKFLTICIFDIFILSTAQQSYEPATARLVIIRYFLLINITYKS